MRKRRSRPSSPPRTSRIRIAVALVFAAALVAAIFLVARGGRAKKPVSSPGLQADDTEIAADKARATPGAAKAYAELSRATWEAGAAAAANGPPSDESKWRQRMEDTRAALLTKWQYPPFSVALAGKTDLIPPHFVAPTMRPLQPHKGDNKSGRVGIKQTQDRLFLGAGEQGVAMFEPTVDGQHVAVDVTRAQMFLTKTDAKERGPAAGNVSFRDDGQPPDAAAGDGVYSALVPPSLDLVRGFSGEILIEVDVSSSGDTGTLQYRFGQAASVPARFTQQIRTVIENGSLAVYIGVEVFTAGHYDFRARLFDAKNQPVAFMTFVDDIGTDAHEIRLLGFGKLLRDQNAAPPFTVKDVEGWRYVIGSYPDREQMVMWPCGAQTSAFDMSQLSDATWESPQKAARLKTIDDNLAHGPSEIAPVDSNGIPLPPPPEPGRGPGAGK